MSYLHHPITEKSFAIIDREIGPHPFSPEQYAVVRRVIHSTADFEFKSLVCFSPNVIEHAIQALRAQTPIITDVSMVRQGIQTLVRQTFKNPIIVAVEQVQSPLPGKTRTESGLLKCLTQYPTGIFVIGNAPTALLALCKASEGQATPPETVASDSDTSRPLTSQRPCPSLVIGAPVGFVAVEESKAALAQTSLPQICVSGRKGGSPVAAAILNALLVQAWDQQEQR